MKRLTERSLDYCTQLCSDEDAISCAFYKGEQEEKCWRANMYDRLAAYEDTGLEPEEINGNIISREYAPLHHWFWVELHQRPERLKKIFDAEQDGRLVVLPCKVGDTVFVLKDTELFTQVVVPLRVQGISVTANNRDVVLHFGGYPFVNALGSEIGKRFFLTREEAECAIGNSNEKASI